VTALRPITSLTAGQQKLVSLPYAHTSLNSVQLKLQLIDAPHWRVKQLAMLLKRLVLPVAIGKREVESVSKDNNGRKSNLYLTMPRRGTPPMTTCKEQKQLALGWMIQLNGPRPFQLKFLISSCSRQETLQSGSKL